MSRSASQLPTIKLESCYDLLQLPMTATIEEIQSMLKFFTERRDYLANKLNLLNPAFYTLCNPTLRSEYDKTLFSSEQSLYTLVNIPITASHDEIKAAYTLIQTELSTIELKLNKIKPVLPSLSSPLLRKVYDNQFSSDKDRNIPDSADLFHLQNFIIKRGLTVNNKLSEKEISLLTELGISPKCATLFLSMVIDKLHDNIINAITRYKDTLFTIPSAILEVIFLKKVEHYDDQKNFGATLNALTSMYQKLIDAGCTALEIVSIVNKTRYYIKNEFMKILNEKQLVADKPTPSILPQLLKEALRQETLPPEQPPERPSTPKQFALKLVPEAVNPENERVKRKATEKPLTERKPKKSVRFKESLHTDSPVEMASLFLESAPSIRSNKLSDLVNISFFSPENPEVLPLPSKQTSNTM